MVADNAPFANVPPTIDAEAAGGCVGPPAARTALVSYLTSARVFVSLKTGFALGSRNPTLGTL